MWNNKAHKNFLTSGKKGDLLFQLYAIKALGGGNLFITQGEFEEPLESVLESCSRLVGSQEYVHRFDIHKGEPIDVNLNDFRASPHLYRRTLLEIICLAHGIKLPKAVSSWIDVPPHPSFGGKIVIHRRTTVVKDRSNTLFDWNKLLNILGPQNCVFVSRLESEWRDFNHPEVEYFCPKDNYEHAQIICASRIFLGNTCFGTALADALGVNRILEVSLGLDRKHFSISYAPNVWYFASPWDCSLKSFRYLQMDDGKTYHDLKTNSQSIEIDSYKFNIVRACSNELFFQWRYRKAITKRLVKKTLGLLDHP